MSYICTVYMCNFYLSSGRLGVILQGRLVNIPKTEVTVTEASKKMDGGQSHRHEKDSRSWRPEI
jgi:hypothetical protein